VDLIDVGYGRRAHGIGGEVVVRSLSDDSQRWIAGATVTTDEATARTLEVSAIRPHRGDLLVLFAGIVDRDAAETLKGVRFRVPAGQRRTLGDDEYWPEDLEGCTVVDPGGVELGSVIGVEFGVAQDRLSIRTAAGVDVAVPLVSKIVISIDLEAGVIIVSPPEGLF